MNPYQIHYHFTRQPKDGFTRREVIQQVWRQYQDTGTTPPGVTITVTEWGRPTPPPAVIRRLKVGRPGIVERYHDPRMTLLDYDTAAAPKLTRFWKMAAQLEIRPTWIEYTRTARGWHVVIQWNRKFIPLETVAMQSILGSDPARETYNLLRLMRGARGRRWNLLFAYKPARPNNTKNNRKEVLQWEMKQQSAAVAQAARRTAKT